MLDGVTDRRLQKRRDVGNALEAFTYVESLRWGAIVRSLNPRFNLLLLAISGFCVKAPLKPRGLVRKHELGTWRIGG